MYWGLSLDFASVVFLFICFSGAVSSTVCRGFLTSDWREIPIIKKQKSKKKKGIKKGLLRVVWCEITVEADRTGCLNPSQSVITLNSYEYTDIVYKNDVNGFAVSFCPKTFLQYMQRERYMQDAGGKVVPKDLPLLYYHQHYGQLWWLNKMTSDSCNHCKGKFLYYEPFLWTTVFASQRLDEACWEFSFGNSPVIMNSPWRIIDHVHFKGSVLHSAGKMLERVSVISDVISFVISSMKYFKWMYFNLWTAGKVLPKMIECFLTSFFEVILVMFLGIMHSVILKRCILLRSVSL